MQSFSDFLLLTEVSTPKFFWLSFDAPVQPYNDETKDVFNSLRSLRMKGVRGVSMNSDNFRNWINVRNSVLVMPADEVKRLNPKMEPVQYDNPDAMLKNDMAILRRVWNQRQTGWLDQMFIRIADYTFRGSGIPDASATASRIGDILDKKGVVINSLDDLVKYWIEGLDEYEKSRYSWSASAMKDFFTKNDAKEVFRKSFEQLAQTYGDEGEWVINADSFLIPRNSKVIMPTYKNELADYQQRAKNPLAGDYAKKWLEQYPEWEKNVQSLAGTLKVARFAYEPVRQRGITGMTRIKERPIDVVQYTKKDGTFVSSHTRNYPRIGSKEWAKQFEKD